jgi:hypothetical protein
MSLRTVLDPWLLSWVPALCLAVFPAGVLLEKRGFHLVWTTRTRKGSFKKTGLDTPWNKRASYCWELSF